MANLPTPTNTAGHEGDVSNWNTGKTNTCASGFGNINADPTGAKPWVVTGVDTGQKPPGHLFILTEVIKAFIIGHPQLPLDQIATYIPLASQLADSIIGHYGQFKAAAK